MSLRDTACYTLLISPSSSDPNITELTEAGPSSSGGKGEVRYARVKEKNPGEAYSGAIYDYLTGAKLGSSGFDSQKAKKRRLQLHGPDEDVGFEHTGMINFEWTFTFQGNKFKWTRETYGKDYICAMERKPDPKVEICLAPDKSEPGRLQILHYNIDRFPNEITDLRGLETLLVTTLMCFLDASDDRRPSPAQTPKPVSNEAVAGISTPGRTSMQGQRRPVTPEFLEPEQPNEVLVGLRTSLDEHVARAVALLMDPKVLFVVIRTRDSAATQRALEVSLGVTRFRHREGLSDLHQYVVDEEPPEPVKKGPKVINLDDEPKPAKGKPQWTPPKNVAIYLSTIALPEFSASRRSASNASKKPAAAAASSSNAPAKQQKPPKPAKSSAPPNGQVKHSKTPPQPSPSPAPPPQASTSVAGSGYTSYVTSAAGAVMNAYQAAQARYQTSAPPPAPAQPPATDAAQNGEGKPQGTLGWLFKR